MKKLEILYLPIEAIKSYKNNSKIHPEKQLDQLFKSINEFGMNVPVLLDNQMTLISGHARVKVCKRLGFTEVPTIKVEHLTEVQKRAFIIADNKITENGQWDEELLAQEMGFLIDLDFNLELTGFSTSEIDLMLDEGQEGEEDKLPEIKPAYKPISRAGDIWEMNGHRLFCGSALSGNDFAMLMNENQASMSFIDPPYNLSVSSISGLGKVKHSEFAMASGEMSEEEFTNFFVRFLENLKPNMMQGGILYICIDWRHLYEAITSVRKVGLEVKNICVWAKNNAGMGTFYRSQHEMILVIKNGSGKHTNNFELGQHGRYRTNLWSYPGMNSFGSERDSLLKMHPTVKPVSMIADAIKDVSKRGQIILDCFLGSGSTLIAAEKTGRICYGMEIQPLYVDTAIRRWQQYTGKDAVRLSDGATFNSLEVSHA